MWKEYFFPGLRPQKATGLELVIFSWKLFPFWLQATWNVFSSQPDASQIRETDVVPTLSTLKFSGGTGPAMKTIHIFIFFFLFWSKTKDTLYNSKFILHRQTERQLLVHAVTLTPTLRFPLSDTETRLKVYSVPGHRSSTSMFEAFVIVEVFVDVRL